MTLTASFAVLGLAKGISEISGPLLASIGMPGFTICPQIPGPCGSVGGRVMRVSIHPYATGLARTLYLEQGQKLGQRATFLILGNLIAPFCCHSLFKPDNP